MRVNVLRKEKEKEKVRHSIPKASLKEKVRTAKDKGKV